eukprot:501559-Rhodomonas_salina.2
MRTGEISARSALAQIRPRHLRCLGGEAGVRGSCFRKRRQGIEDGVTQWHTVTFSAANTKRGGKRIRRRGRKSGTSERGARGVNGSPLVQLLWTTIG